VIKVFLVLLFSFSLAQAQDVATTFLHGGLERTYLLHIPPGYQATTPAPLVMVLHGRGGSGEHIAGYTKFNTLADQQTFITLYPDGLQNQWNYVRGVPGYNTLTTDDIGFLLALIKEVQATHSIDSKRIYVAGFSNGGFMTQRLACEAPETFAAYASVSAAGFGGLLELCTTPHPMSILLMHGTSDRVIPWDGLSRDGFLMLAPVPESIAFWAGYSGCEVQPKEMQLEQSAPETRVQILSVNCPEGNEVILYSIHGGGHNWPGKTGIPKAISGNVSMDIDATEVIWNFFKAHARP
jgi:polyhydroxybutyrate depolymerase